MSAPARGDRYADYIPVNERIVTFYEQHPEGRIITAILDHDREAGFILIRAEVYRNPDDAMPSASGHAYEYKTDGPAQRSSYVEVCETSAVGRALVNLGLEVKRSGVGRESGPRATSPPSPSASSEWQCNKSQQTMIEHHIGQLAKKGLSTPQVADLIERASGVRDPRHVAEGDVLRVIAAMKEALK
jgi:hypothetical protein